MATNNAINFPGLTVKSTPTIADLIYMDDAAAANITKEATFDSLPDVPNGAFLAGTGIVAAMPGQFTNVTSNTVAQAVAINNIVILTPFCMNQDYTMANISTYVITGLAASTVTMGIYAGVLTSFSGFNFIYPIGAPLAVTSGLSTASNSTLVTGSLALSLTSKTVYFCAIQASTQLTLSLQALKMSPSICTSNQTVSATGFTAQNVAYSNTYSAGTLPTIVVASIIGSGNSYSPAILIT